MLFAVAELLVHVQSGVRQGGVLFPLLFNFCINELICSLKNSDLGCHVRDVYIGCILSASVCMLQNMLDICIGVSTFLYLSFNSSKSQCIAVGRNKFCNIPELMLNDNALKWVTHLKYLRVSIVSSNSFSVCLDGTRLKYFAAANALNAHCKYISEPVKLQMFESYCLPVLLYGIDCINLSKQQIHELTVCWNNAYRKIFGFKMSESVKTVIYFMQRIDFRKLYDLRHLMFMSKLRYLQRDVIVNLLPLSLTADDVNDLFCTYDVTMYSTQCCIKTRVFSAFENCSVGSV